MSVHPSANHDRNIRGLNIRQAADYCGVTIPAFRTWVRDGLVPGPWPGTKRYDRKALDNALDKLSGLSENQQLSDYEKWKITRHAHTSETHS